MDQFKTFLDMGGYAVWVWTSYGVSIGALLAMLIFSLRGLRAREHEFEALKSERKGVHS